MVDTILKCSGCKRPLPGSKGGLAAHLGTLKCSACSRSEAKGS